MNLIYFIPTLNSGKTLELNVKSLLTQTDKKNIIIIDGGSSDSTLYIAKKYKIKVIKQTKLGLADARNLAIKSCKTEFIAFIDSDCVIEKDWTEKIMSNFNDKNVAGVCGKLIEKNTKNLADKWRAFHLRQDWGNKKIQPSFLFGSNTIFRTNALKKIKGYDEKFLTNYEDVDISRRLKKQYKIIYEPKAVAFHLRTDNLKTILKTTRAWSFYSYPVPNNLKNIILRFFIYNPHFFFVYLFNELKNLKLNLIFLNIILLVYNEIYDLGYYRNEVKK